MAAEELQEFEVEVYELHSHTKTIQAASLADAIQRVLAGGEGDDNDDGTDLIEGAERYGIGRQELGDDELFDELERRGMVRDGIVFGLRSAGDPTS